MENGTMENGNVDSTFYWPKWSRFDEHGNLEMKASGYNADCHWRGRMTVESTGSDYPFWVWVINEKNPQELIDDTELARLKQEFEDKES